MTAYQVMPRLSEDERADLEQSIKANGVIVPVLIDDGGEIIDGHHRAEIADRLGIEYSQVTKDGTPTELRTLAYSLNLHRRHLSREQRRELVQISLRSDPQLSNREHGRRTGTDHKTVGGQRDDLEAGGEIPHLPMRDNPQGRPQPATKPDVDTTGRDTLAAEFIGKYSVLAYYADQPAKVIATGRQLDTFSGVELPGRLDNLAKHIAAERRSDAEPPKPETPDYYAMAGLMFDAANNLCQVIDKHGGADTLTAALADADPLIAQLWIDQFASATKKLLALHAASRPTLRSVR